MNEELYSYFIGSLALLNKSIKIQDSKNTQLFSYFYNNYTNMNNQIENLKKNDNVEVFSYYMSYMYNGFDNINEQMNNISNQIRKIDRKINVFNEKTDNIIKFINNQEQKPVIKEKSKFYLVITKICLNIIQKISKLSKIIWKKIHDFVFKRKIQKELELQKQKEIELENKRRKEKQKLINNILNNSKPNGYQAKSRI